MLLVDQLTLPEVQYFITDHISIDVKELAFKKNPFENIEYSKILEQISGKQKAKGKLPTWFASKNIVYPSKISVEQTSSEATATYKASLVSGKSLIDLTGGFGIDDFYFSKQFDTVVHCELNTELSEIVQHNYKQLNVTNIECIAGDSREVLQQKNQQFDCIYIDPSRRNDAKGKVFMLRDCLPNVPDNLDFYFSFSKNILVKTAPILDIQAGLQELKFVKRIHIVAFHNEVKELIWEIEKDYTDDILLVAVNIENDTIFKTEIPIHSQEKYTYSMPLEYLYEPNASLMKSGKFEAIGSIFKVLKLHSHSHLYTSEKLLPFHGRRFKIQNAFTFDKKNAKEFLQNKKMNVSCRNFPLIPEALKKKFKIKDGGDVYAFFTTNLENQKIIVLCEKI